MSEWISVKKQLPANNIVCMVTNIKAGIGTWMCLYDSNYNYFRWYNPDIRDQPPVEVTHWFEIPTPYGLKDEEL